jgi:hypothetical protein
VSVWNRIGQFAKDVGGAVASPAKFVWDVASSPFNDKEEFNGIANTLSTATKNFGSAALKPVSDVVALPGISQAVNAINTVNQNVIREPLATTALAIGDTLSGKGNIFNPNEWKKAYAGAQNISFGQAVTGIGVGLANNQFDIYDPAQRKAAFKDSMFGNIASGALDIGIQFAGDVTLGLGKGVKLAKASEYGVGAIAGDADKAAHAAEQITKAVAGEKNRFTKLVKDFTQQDSTYAINHPMVKSSNEPGLLAHLLGKSKDEETTGLVLRTALGDQHAFNELAAVRPDITQAINNANKTIDEFDKFKANLASDAVIFPWEGPTVVAEAKAALEASIKHDEQVAKLMQLGAGGGSLTRTTGTTLQGVEDFVAKARSTAFYDKAVGSPTVKFYQATPFHRMYQVISQAEHERPAGLADVNDPDSYKEVIATIGRGQKLARMTEAESKFHLDNYTKQLTPEGRTDALHILEKRTLVALATKHNLTEEHALAIWQQVHDARTSAVNTIKEKAFMVDQDKGILKFPVFESQTANFVPIMDFDLMNRLLKRHNSAISLLGRTKDTTVHYADILQDAFKAAALLRGGYTIRNGIDSQLRIMASVGAMASVRHLGEGMKNVMFDRIKAPQTLVDHFKFLPSKGADMAQVALERKGVSDEIASLESRIAALEKSPGATATNEYVLDADVLTEINTLKNLLEEKTVVDSHYASLLSRMSKKNYKTRMGEGLIEHTTSDGQTYKLYDAFGGPLGEMFRNLNSSASTYSRLIDSNSDHLSSKLTSKGIGAIGPDDAFYAKELANTLNRDFANSTPIRMLASGMKPAEVIDWLKHDTGGQDLRKRLNPETVGRKKSGKQERLNIGINYDEVESYVNKINGFLDTYLPADSQILRDKLAKRQPITEEEIRASHAGIEKEDLPVIHGNVIEENIRNNSLISIKGITNGLFKFLGSMPEDAWARHPLYRNLYQDEMTRRIEFMSQMKKDRLTPAEQEAIMKKSHDFAQRGVKNILFNIERRTNLATHLKFISPFFSAQENAVKTWAKMGINNPAIINRGAIIWNSPNRAGLVTDKNGNVVPAGQSTDQDTIWLEMPDWAKRLPLIGPGISVLDQQGIPKQSLDIIFAGGMNVLYGGKTSVPFNDVIPVGPYVAIPASELAKRQPAFEDALKWALPFGPTSGPIYEGLLPAWVKRAQTLAAGQDSQEYVRTYQLIHTTELHNAKADGRPMPSEATIKRMTDDFYKMRIVANLVMPYSPKFDSPYRLYLDKYREYQRKYTELGQADAMFLQDYPEYFDFAVSLSANKTGALASQGTYANTKKYGDLVADVYKDEPSLVGLITNNPTGNDFSQAVYDWQYSAPIGPGTSDTFRSNANAQDAEQQNQVKLGWIKYRNVMNQVDAELKNRGLSATNQKGAEDLNIIKQLTINALSYVKDEQGNPVLDANGQASITPWFESYRDLDGTKTLRVISGLNKITSDEKFIKDHSDKKGNLNPTWASVSTYLQIRQQLSNELATRPVKGLTAKANGDVYAIYQAMVSKLKDGNIGFGDIYDRYLSQDQVYYKFISEAALKGAKA